MSKKRTGTVADNVFTVPKMSNPDKQERPITTHPTVNESQERQGRGRPQEHKESWTKATVVLLDTQIHWLDKLALDMRQNTKSAISRAEIIRAAISAMEESGIDFTMATSEQEIKEIVLRIGS